MLYLSKPILVMCTTIETKKMNKSNLISTAYYLGIILISYPLCAYWANSLRGINLPESNSLFIPCIILLVLYGFVLFHLKKKHTGIFSFIVAIIYIITIGYDLTITYP